MHRLFLIRVCVCVAVLESVCMCVCARLGSIEEEEKQRDPLLRILMHYQPTAAQQAAATNQGVESLYHIGTVRL